MRTTNKLNPAGGVLHIAPLISRILVVAAMILSTLQSQADSGAPESRGHPLSYWLEQMLSGSAVERNIAEVAIREIGSNGLPAMLVWLRYEPSQTKTNILEFLKLLRGSANGRWIPAELTYERGAPPGYIGFNALGPAAAPAIPELEQIANDAQNPRPAARAMMALSAIGPAALSAVESRLANTNFPLPPDAAVNMYLRTRTSSNCNRLSAADARPILIELETNANPLLVKGATQLLKMLNLPSSLERGETKSFLEALSDLRTEREMGSHLQPGWNIHPRDKPSREEQLAASNAVYSAMTRPPVEPKGDEPYPYPLQTGTPAWNYAEAEERVRSIEIPRSWREHATSWQLFRSAIGNPYFRTIFIPGEDIGRCYEASRSMTVSILQEVDNAPEFGTNVLRWLSDLDLAKMAASHCEEPYEPCFMDYMTVWYMAGLESALKTLDVGSRQRLYRLAVWDADYFLSRSEDMMASGPVGLIYTLAKKPETFRGDIPSGVVFSPSSGNLPPLDLGQGLELRSAVATAKAALELKERP